MHRRLLALILLACLLLMSAAEAKQGPAGSTSSSSSSNGIGSQGTAVSAVSSGGGGSRQIDLERVLKAVEDGKKQKPKKFEELKTILWKDPITPDKYVLPTVLMRYNGNNTTVSRSQLVEITTVVTNKNPLEMRRMLDLYLEVKNPGSNEYERLNSWPEKIQTNEYNEKTNTTYRIWGMLPSFSYLKTAGVVKVRANVSDGVNKWSTVGYRDVKAPYYTELIFNVTNSKPIMSNFTVTPQGKVRYNDPIEYKAVIADSDKDTLNITLHILDREGKELDPPRNETQEIKGGGQVRFKANEYGFFSEADAGENFTYCYSFDDGINTSKTDIQSGPAIRRGPKLFVDKAGFTAESDNHYWWQWYTFYIRAKNQNSEEFDVVFTLYTNTNSNPGKVVESKAMRIGPEPQMIYFNKTKPFVVSDANESFSYMIKFSEYDQNGKDSLHSLGPRINPKIVPYSIYHPIMIFNLAMMFCLIMITGLLFERKFKRGIESQESSSGKSKGKNEKAKAKESDELADKISNLFKRKS